MISKKKLIESRKVFNLRSEKGLKSAERYQQHLYKHYDVVKVEPQGMDKVTIWGEKKVR